MLGVLAGTIGILQANEAVKEILEIGDTLADRLLIYDALEMKFRSVGRAQGSALPALQHHPDDHRAGRTSRFMQRVTAMTTTRPCIVCGVISGKPQAR